MFRSLQRMGSAVTVARTWPAVLTPKMMETARPTCMVPKAVTSSSASTVWSIRNQHSAPQGTVMQNMSQWEKIKWNMGMYGKLQVPNRRLKLAGYNLYICCSDFLDHQEIFKETGLPDTFNSWFLVLQLHLWLLNTKLSQMGKEGELLKRYVYTALWIDVEKRLATFEDLHGSEKRKESENLYNLMVLSIMNYDEGLLGSDKTLANALWVQLFSMDENVTAESLELMVAYVRKQVHHLLHQELWPIMWPGFITFLPLHGNKISPAEAEKNKELLYTYMAQKQ